MNKIYHTCRGLVLRASDYRDADRILTVLSEEGGCIVVKARRAKRPSARILAASQPFAYSLFTLFDYRGRYSIKEVAPMNIFFQREPDIERVSVASYFCEMIEIASQEDDPGEDLLRFTLNGLYALDKTIKPLLLIKAAFEFKLMCILGYAPLIESCFLCGAAHSDTWHLGVEHGRLWCRRCAGRATGEKVFEITVDVLTSLRYIQNADMRRMFSFSLAETELIKLVKFCEAYTIYHFGRGFYTLDYFNSIRM